MDHQQQADPYVGLKLALANEERRADKMRPPEALPWRADEVFADPHEMIPCGTGGYSTVKKAAELGILRFDPNTRGFYRIYSTREEEQAAIQRTWR